MFRKTQQRLSFPLQFILRQRPIDDQDHKPLRTLAKEKVFLIRNF